MSSSLNSESTRVVITLPVKVSKEVDFLLSYEYQYYTDKPPEYLLRVIEAAKAIGCTIQYAKFSQKEVNGLS